MEGTPSLISAMDELGLTQAELAERINDFLRSRGYDGTVSDRTVRNWLTGKTHWPHPRQREALGAVFGCTAEELGFSPPSARHISTEPEPPVERRNFLSAATGTAVAIVAPVVDSRPSIVGTSDVISLRSGLDALMALDAARGGHEALERSALAGADEALDKVRQAASQRIRQRLYSVAANYLSTAAWAAIDGRQLDRAQARLDRAVYLAGMAKDPVVELRVWNSYAMLAHQRDNFTDAVDAGYAAQATAIARRDPFYGSLTHARTAVAHATLGDRQGTIRSLGYAEEALGKATDDETRPSWVAFYGVAELTAMTAIARDRIGDSAEAEAASHKALSGIPKHFKRNRALATARLALTQVHQRDLDPACTSASEVFELMSGNPIPGRMRSLLGDFYRDLITLAPDASVAREWGDRYRSEWSRA
ncbi:helix-turn-helix transcriptional regulator [Streptomyces fulvoviolaceus]|uniref:helix-turn-helix transcriptional regulator n=1 Tax=Streptomyces fulvoviolaceus TaxID=285535 RepID=UPI0021C1FAB9|nr:helix-turn-helix transcriptional regulator [Streptomyces fulvoviolaceus]MCT9077892.1 helix-turn-helix domain-containing protein [Streptomyces fulvoviolaceus]